jgi:hypothetical protein
MRTKGKLGVFAVLSLATAVSVAGVATAGTDSQGPITQAMEVALTPTAAPKKLTKEDDPQPGKIGVGVEVTNSTPNQSSPPATTVDIIFDEDIFFTTKGLDTCTTAEIVQLRSDAARQQCKNALVTANGPPILPTSTATNTALAQCGTTGDPASQIPAVVSAFNGPRKGKNPTLLLHTDATPPGSGTVIVQVLEGTIINTAGPGPGERGLKPKSKTLRVTVPPLAGGACAIKRFEATIQEKYTVSSGSRGGKREKRSYISQLCSDGTWNFDSKFTFNPDPAVNPNGVQTLSPTDEISCRRKK